MGGYRPRVSLSAEDREKMSVITGKWSSTAARIRVLDAAGYNRQEIATFLGKSYQHVYNTLKYPLAGYRNTGGADTPPPVSTTMATEASDADTGAPRIYRFSVAADGSITLSADALAQLDAVPGRIVTARFEDGELRLMSIDAAVRFVQKLAAPYIKEGEGNWSDELIAERRAEAKRDVERDGQ